VLRSQNRANNNNEPFDSSGEPGKERLADNLGYDVSNIIGLPYDWRLSPDKMEQRDGFLTMMRRRIEAAVATNGEPGIMVAHSMGNLIFRYFLEWLRVEMQEKAYRDYVKRAKKRAQTMMQKRSD
jgi:hypothetical protein